MASTYSITFSVTNGNVGYPARNQFLPIKNQIEDAYVRNGNKHNAMMNNTRIQVKKQDGSLANYTIDAERSDPSKNLIFLLPV